MKHILLLILVCSGLSYRLPAQTVSLNPEQVQRLAQLSKLYGHIKYFHPYLGYRNINWDSAFAAAAPRLIYAGSEQEQASAIQRMLDALTDPVTKVILSNPETENLSIGTAQDSLQFYFTPDSLLVVKTNNYYGFDNYVFLLQQLDTVKIWIKSAKGLLLDMRAKRQIRSDVLLLWPFSFDYSEISSMLVAQPVITPGHRLRMHNGFTPESSGTSGGYYSGFYTKSGVAVPAVRRPLPIPVVVLINAHSDVPAQALALSQAPGNALFVVGMTPDGSLAERTVFDFSPRLKVNIRLSEVVGTDGSIGVGKHRSFPDSAAWEAPELAAMAFIRGHPDTYPVKENSNSTGVLPVTPQKYPKESYPTLGYRLLAGAKIWTVIQYFFAYKHLIPGNWDQTLNEYLPRLAAAEDSLQYATTIAQMYRNIQDGHGFVASAVLREYFGLAAAPITLRFVEEKAVVTGIWVDSIAQKAGIGIGDVILEIDGEKTEDRVRHIGALLNASNEWTRKHYVSSRLLRGREGNSLRVKILDKSNREKTVFLPLSKNLRPVSDRAKEDTVRILPGNIGYVDLGRLAGEDVGKMFDRLKDTRAIIFDMRGYPNGTAWQIAPRLTYENQVIAAQFSRYAPVGPDLLYQDQSNTSTKYSFVQHIPPNLGLPVYKGKTLMLIDERTQSQAEHTGLFLEAANGTEFIGSPTAGANGDVTNFLIPGNITLGFSGHDVRHADGRQLQQIGLQPKISVKPTVSGIRAGKDEVLEAAKRYLSGQ